MIYQGYIKYTHPATGLKYYRAQIATPGNGIRYTRRKFRRASDAQIYGYKLAQRCRRLERGA